VCYGGEAKCIDASTLEQDVGYITSIVYASSNITQLYVTSRLTRCIHRQTDRQTDIQTDRYQHMGNIYNVL